ncbi:MAG: GYF domain-containing protein [Hyphomicrobiaceae bacterium]
MTDAQGSGSNGSGSGGGAPPVADTTWYIARDGQQHGPLSDAEMRLFVDGGHLRSSDLLWRPGFPDWKPAPQVFPPRQSEPKPVVPPPPAPPQRAAPRPSPQAGAAHPLAAAASPAQQAAATGARVAGDAPAGEATARQYPAANPASTATNPHGRQQPAPQPSGTPPRTEQPQQGRPGAGRPDMGHPDTGQQGYNAAPRTARTAPTPAGSGQPQAAARAPAPAASSQAMLPVASDDNFAYEPLEKQRPRVKVIGLGVLLVAVIAASTWFVIENKSALMDKLGLSNAARGDVPVVKADRTSQPTKVEAAGKAAVSQPGKPLPQMASNDPSLVAPPRQPQPDAAAMDMSLQRRPLWTFMKSRFPDWYGERVSEAAVMVAAERPPREVTKHLVDALVDFRRKNADAALKASTERHRAIATAFLDNLQTLSSRSADLCYSFISQGETSGVIVDLMTAGDASQALEKQAIAIFEAVDEGQRQPVAHDRPKKEDYDVLASQLGKLGWSQADLQMFADPKALSAATPARVCQMVRDWFKAHIEIADGTVQQRLLYETLRPVVGG